MDKDYTKINLRDFRHNLTQLKDSLESGEVYEILNRGEVFGYLVPATYELKLKKKSNKEAFMKAFKNAVGCAKRKGDENFDYKKEYRKLLEKKYLE